jgi:hypothetical protein
MFARHASEAAESGVAVEAKGAGVEQSTTALFRPRQQRFDALGQL